VQQLPWLFSFHYNDSGYHSNTLLSSTPSFSSLAQPALTVTAEAMSSKAKTLLSATTLYLHRNIAFVNLLHPSLAVLDP
jgi:hypothetical protein